MDPAPNHTSKNRYCRLWIDSGILYSGGHCICRSFFRAEYFTICSIHRIDSFRRIRTLATNYWWGVWASSRYCSRNNCLLESVSITFSKYDALIETLAHLSANYLLIFSLHCSSFPVFSDLRTCPKSMNRAQESHAEEHIEIGRFPHTRFRLS